RRWDIHKKNRISWVSQRLTLVLVASYLVVMCESTRAADRAFREPAPPVNLEISPMRKPEAKPHPEVKFHHRPKTLSRDAVTHDWTAFLGPTHNAVSTETKLLHSWPK